MSTKISDSSELVRRMPGSSRNVTDYKKRPLAAIEARRIEDVYPVPRQVPSRPQVAMSNPKTRDISKQPVSRRIIRPLKSTYVFSSMAGLVFVVGLSVSLFQIKPSNITAVQAAHQNQENSSVTESNSVPDETPPTKTSIKSYTVPATQPRLLSIDKLSVQAKVKRVGVDVKNQLIAPKNIFDVGWYEDSSKPSDGNGAILIDGHVSGPSQKGVFYDLKKLKAGDIIKLEQGDGKSYKFKVSTTKVYDADKVDMVAAMTSAIPGKLGLNLLTCTGKFDSQSDQYKQRLIVFAVLAN